MPTILIVDDEEPIRSILKRVAQTTTNNTHTVVTFDGVGNALEWISRIDEAPALIITDYKMCGRHGTEILHATHIKWPHVPVIMVTGTAHSDQEIADFKKNGLFDYLVKPCTSGEMTLAITKALNRA